MRINFELTNLCNLSCVHCIRNSDATGQYLSVALIEKVLSGIHSCGPVEMVSFGGGEPTLSPTGRNGFTCTECLIHFNKVPDIERILYPFPYSDR
jgi:hypothetical protein